MSRHRREKVCQGLPVVQLGDGRVDLEAVGRQGTGLWAYQGWQSMAASAAERNRRRLAQAVRANKCLRGKQGLQRVVIQ